jgi:mono/diheme cytochrome c family protein
MNSLSLKGINKSGIAAAGIFFIIVSFLFLFKAGAATMELQGEKVMEEKCSKCHNTRRIWFFKRTPEEWNVTVRRMKEKDPMWLSEEEVTACVNFLNLTYARTGKDLFKPLCVDCHVVTGKKQLLYQRKTRPARARAIERMRRKYSFLIGVADAKQINEFWTDPNNNKNLKLDVEETDLIEGVFENKCGRCHTYAFMYGQKRARQAWPEILNRMQKKSPEWLGAQDLEQIKRYIFSHRKFLRDK